MANEELNSNPSVKLYIFNPEKSIGFKESFFIIITKTFYYKI
jgi:hypothetical protein